MNIIFFNNFHSSDKVQQIKSIFLEASGKVFASEDQENIFFLQWCDYYLNNESQSTLLAIHENQIVGYIMGALDSQIVLKNYGKQLTGLDTFKENFKQYPAHLHINFKKDFRGKGLGSLLLEEFERYVLKNNGSGIHIITSPKAPNRFFYTKNGFSYTEEKSIKSTSLLFMGKTI